MSKTANIPDPIAALQEVVDRMVPFEQHDEFAGLSPKGMTATQKDFKDYTVKSRLPETRNVVTAMGEGNHQVPLHKTEIVAIQTGKGNVYVVERQVIGHDRLTFGPEKGKVYPLWKVERITKADEDEARAILNDARAFLDANDAAISAGWENLDGGTELPVEDQAADV